MSTHIYHWREDLDGETGWVLRGYPNFNAADIHLMAHDCLEHLPRGSSHGAIADEAMALGARLYLRVYSGWWFDQKFNHSVSAMWAYEITNLHNDAMDTKTPMPAALAHIEIDPNMEEILQNAGREALKSTFDESDRDDVDAIISWMRRGYRAAIERWKDHDPLDVMWLAECLTKAAQPYKFGDLGDRLIITVNESALDVRVTRRSMY